MIIHREVSVDRNTATETQTLKQGQGDRKTSREPKKNDKNQKTQRKSGSISEYFGSRHPADNVDEVAEYTAPDSARERGLHPPNTVCRANLGTTLGCQARSKIRDT